MTTIVAKGNTEYLSVSGTAANVAFAPSLSNTFRISNTSLTGDVFVGVYNSATVAANIVVPTAGSPYPGVVRIGPGASETIGGNFGAQNTATIYVAAVSGTSADIYITPVA